MLHLPMEAHGHKGEPGVNVLALKDSHHILRERMARMLGAFDGYIGVNNHMGSRFTRDAGRMKIVLTELRRRGLFFFGFPDEQQIRRRLGYAAGACRLRGPRRVHRSRSRTGAYPRASGRHRASRKK